MTARRLEIFVIVTIIALIGVIYALTKKPVLAPATNTGINQSQNQNPRIAPGEPNPSAPVEYKGQNGKNALELLKLAHKVDVKSYSFGDMVTGIDGITPDAKHFWAMYVNGKFSQVGASQYMTKLEDSIKWQIDAIK
ncbi:MAG TPA: DUF4430 domain-containing protein [Patescibacteria group bacterium]